MDAPKPLPADLYDVLDHLAKHDQVREALALAERELRAHPREIPLLAWQGWLLKELKRGDEAMRAYERQQAIILAEDPPTPHRWQLCGFSLYEQARAARALGRPEARHLVAEALTRIGTFIDHPAWFEAGQWAWLDGDYDVAGRLWHHLLLKGCQGDSLARHVEEACASIGESHAHDWVWLARMRSQLSPSFGLDTAGQLARIEALYPHVAHHPMAWRLRARMRQMAGELEGASADLDRYLAQGADPRSQVFRCALDHQMGRPHGLAALQWSRDTTLGGGDYYAGGCDVAELVRQLRAAGACGGGAELARLDAVEAQAYLLGAARFEHYFATGEGTCQDAEPHLYAMLCNNLGVTGFNRQERYAEGVAWHDKGWAVSPFWEQYANRLECQLRAGQWAGVIESFDALRDGGWKGWDASADALAAAWAHARLGQHAEVLALYREFVEDSPLPFEAAIASIDAESRQAGLMALAAESAAALGDRHTLATVGNRLLASDRLSANLCSRLAGAWSILGEPAEARHCTQTWLGTDPSTNGPEPRALTAQALQAMVDSLALDGGGYVWMRLGAASPQGWQFTLQSGAAADEGDRPGRRHDVPLCIDAQQGSEPGQAMWRMVLYHERAGIFGRLRGRARIGSVAFAHAPRSSSGERQWAAIDADDMPPIWPQLCERFAAAEAVWARLLRTVTLSRVQALLDRLAEVGVDPGSDLNLGLCRLMPGTGEDGGSHGLKLLFDRHADGDLALPPSAFDPYSFRYEIVSAYGEPYLIYLYQDRNHGSACQINAGDVALTRAAHELFLRVEKRALRWAGARHEAD